MTGIEFIAQERERKKGPKDYDYEKDGFQLSVAAAMYIANAYNKDFKEKEADDGLGPVAMFELRTHETEVWKEIWPWTDKDGRGNADVFRSLVKAGALITAELDRLIEIERDIYESDNGKDYEEDQRAADSPI